MIKLILTTFLFSILLCSGCDDNKPTEPLPEPRPEGWIALGLADKTINRLVIAGEWLYACAARDGLYRIKHPANRNDEWQFLGLEDLDVFNGALFGVTDVVVRDDTLVAAVWSGTETPGIFRSVDDGRTWVPSDSGFLSEDLGSSRRPILGFDSGAELSFHSIGLHSRRESEIWVGGDVPNSGLPLLYRSMDTGLIWQEVLKHPHDPFLFPDDANDIAFDARNDETVYVCLNKTLVKSEDSGKVWVTSIDTLDKGIIWNVTSNASDSAELIVCSTDSLYATRDAGASWSTFAAAPEKMPPMKDLAVDWQERVLYVSSTYNPSRGVYQLYS
ncbi:MAG: WD40/YVTN/BNR-like repeat-containing protein [bacterium]